MGYGIEIKNSNGDLIIDGNSKNFAEYASGSVSGTGGLQLVSFTATDQIPIVAIRPDAAVAIKYAILFALHKTGSDYDGFYIVASLNLNVDYKVYVAHPAAAGSAQYGLHVWNEDGELIFDSSNKYFDIYSVTTGISITASINIEGAGSYSDVSHPGISDPYYFLSPLSFWIIGAANPPQPGPIYGLRPGLRKIDSTNVRIAWYPVSAGQSLIEANDGWNPNLNLMILR
jgi:hypothetical protein